MSNNKENFIRADPVPTDAEIELAVERLRPNWTRGVPRSRTGGTSHILQSLAHGRSHAVVLEIKRSSLPKCHVRGDGESWSVSGLSAASSSAA